MAIKGIIGLGNTGKKYHHTYHNIGAWSLPVLKELAMARGMDALLWYQPEGFMNESGRFVASWLKMNNMKPEEAVVVHDDSDLPVGEYKISLGGSSAGHNGIQNIIDALGTEDFLRLRVGIRDPHEAQRKKALEFVLDRFPESLEGVFKDTVSRGFNELIERYQTKD